MSPGAYSSSPTNEWPTMDSGSHTRIEKRITSKSFYNNFVIVVLVQVYLGNVVLIVFLGIKTQHHFYAGDQA
jgi:hypothetical protein